MHALVIVAVIIGVIFVSLACLLSVWSDLHTRIEFPVLAQPYDDERRNHTATPRRFRGSRMNPIPLCAARKASVANELLPASFADFPVPPIGASI